MQTMKSKIILCLALIAFNLSANARAVRSWSDAELLKASDLVVVGVPIKVKDLDETNSLGWSQSESFWPRFRGVETTFKVSDVLKGMPANDRVVLHHYRIEIEWESPANGPDFIGFTPNSTNKYLLYLIKDGTNRYAPAAGQIDPGLSIKPAPDLFQRQSQNRGQENAEFSALKLPLIFSHIQNFVLVIQLIRSGARQAHLTFLL
jgi:hypothetical protein